MTNTGWIKLHRQIGEWEWWQNIPAKVLFLQLLIEANHETARWQGVEVLPGQLIFGRKEMALRCGLSEQSLRTALSKLKSTSELTIKSTSRYSLVTINNWLKYQDTNQQTNQQTNQRLTNNQPAVNHNIRSKEYKEYKEVYTEGQPPACEKASTGGNSTNVVREKFGETGSVLLTTEEYVKLCRRYGRVNTKRYITKLENYMLSKGKKYKDHYRTLLTWFDIAKEKGNLVISHLDFDIADFETEQQYNEIINKY